MQCFYKICFIFYLSAWGISNTFSQSVHPDLPGPGANLQTATQGSLVIPMDNAHQNLFLAYPFNLKAYGLVNQLLQNDIPVYWVIKAGKAKDGIDFSATVERVYPSFVAASFQDFRASEFIVDSFWVNNPSPTTGKTATQVISTFANQWKVAVYRLTANTTVDVRYTLNHHPKIALFNNGGNEAIAQTILDTAKIANYVVISAGVFPGLAQCYTFCSEMHWLMTDADTVITVKVLQFVNDGGNFFAQCHAVEGGDNLEGYERNEKFQTTLGLQEIGIANASNTYYNPDLAFMQFEGLMQPNQGGSGKNWRLHAGSSWKSGVYHAVSTQNSLDTVIATGSHLAPPDSIGGNVFYLGGHNYKPYTSLLQINAARLYLNAALIPARRPTVFVVNAGSNTTICQGNSITLGGSPTGPGGATYIWSPSSSLNNSTSPNPIATPTSATLYTVVADNGGCTSNGAVTISVSASPTVTASQNNISCFGGSNGTATVSVSGGTPSYTYSWSNGQTTSSATGLIAGNYSVIITDAAGCIKTSTVSITQPAVLTSAVSQINVSCNGGGNGTATVTASGGTISYSYLWNNGQTTSSATNLSAGNYSVTVTDSKGCTTTNTFSITQPAAALSSTASQNNVSCFGGGNGTATVAASGGTTAYTYSWSNGQTTFAISNLTAGNYSVTVTDSKGCTITNTFSITQPAAPLSSSASQNNVSCNGGGNGTATVTASGGTTAYTYSWSNGQTTSSATGLIAGNYSVTITDANGCTTTSSVSITQPAAALSSTTSQNNVSCNGGNNANASVSVSGGTLNYTYSWSNGQTTSSATGLIAGNYSVTVTDSKGCTTTNTFSITQPAAPLSSSSSQTNVSCNGGSNGSANVFVSGGTTAYTYLWNNGQTTSSATGLIAGNYSVTVTDSKGCTTTNTFSITQPVAPLSSSSSQTNVSCNAGSNGSANVSVSGGTLNYTYSWSNSQTTSAISNLTAGNYSVTITDSKGCIITNTFSVTQPVAPLSSSSSQTNVSCNAGNNGSANVSVSGGTPSYSYLWSNGQTTSMATNLSAGNYSVTITDANGCTTTSTVSILQPVAPLSSSSSQTNVSCNGGSNGTATVSSSGGTPNYTYSWNNGQTTSTAINLAAGNYSVTITDSKGCTITNTFSITQPAAPLSSTASQNNVSCFGGSNGTAAVSSSGGTPNYTYSWSNGQTTSSATNLSAGNYSVTVTDSKGCATTNTISITQPTILTSGSSQTNVSCNGGSNGTANVSASGGTLNYTYSWSNGQTTSTAINLAAGNYSVTITDSKGCTITNTFTVTQPISPLSSSASQNNVSCNGGNNGTATATVSGGTTAYTYSWSNGQTTSSATNLSAANYSVTVTDSKGCTTTNTFTITQPIAPLSSTASQNNVSCNGGNNGTAAVSPSGGTPTYSYLWNNGQTTSAISNLASGNYSVAITDANGCTATTTVSITQPAILIATASQTNVSCNGGSNGTATAMPAGGTSPYSYYWSNGQTTSTATGLSAGNYSVTVTDMNGCTISGAISITQPFILTAATSQTNVSCFGGSNGSASVSPSGGTPNYAYLWSNGQTTLSATNLSAGNYSVTVTDANGCTAIQTVTITQPSLLIAADATMAVSCFGGNNGTASVSASGGTPNYTYLWSNGQTTSSATNLSAGNYSITVTDSKGCTTTSTVSITQPIVLTSAVSQTNVSCFGGGNGTATVSPSGGTPSYSYLWNNGQTTSSATGLITGNYSVTITDTNGCTTTNTISITQPVAPLSSSSSQNNVSCFGGSNGTATVSSFGGTPSYSYLWSNGQTTSTATGLLSGNYSVTITDANGCITTNIFSVTEPTLLASTTSQTNACSGSSSGLANIFASGGTPGYFYSWSNGQTTSSATGLSAGTYSVTITDANGCTQTTSVTIMVFPILFSTASQTNVSCFGGSNGSATDSAFGGTSPFTYLWSSGQTTSAITNLPVGNYTAIITDANGCTVVNTVTITEPLVLAASTSSTASGCSACTGTSTANASGGTPSYAYLWNPTGQTTQTATGLCAGTYTCVVSDANGCTTSQAVTITGQLTLSINSQTNVSCFGGSNGTAAVTSTGGNSPYTYLWSSGQTTSAITGLSAGTYTLTVTDANGCGNMQTVTITQPTALTSTAAQTNVCSGASTGTAAVAAAGGTPAYTYLWSNGQTTVVITGLSAGSYSVTTTDANGCTTTATVITIIPFPAVLSAASQMNVSCFGGSNGSAADSAFGGTPAFTYSWSSGQTTSAISGLSAGNYIAIITDVNGCTKADTISITQPAILNPNSSQTNVLCFGGSNGTAMVSPSGGTPSYFYLWSNGQTTSASANLSAGNYSITITDANGCITTDTILITEPALLTSTASQTNVSCFGGSDGTITANASGGTSPYSYLWNPSGQTTSSATNLSVGNYSVTITDANGCVTIDSAFITQPSVLTAVTNSAPDTCLQANGTASVSVSGGTSSYSYLWNNGQTTSTATGLLPGNYSVTVTDANGCTFSNTVTVNYTGSAVANAGSDASICFGSSTLLNASGGIIYTWSPVNGLSNPNISNPTASPTSTTFYIVTVTASNGCAALDTVTVTVNPLPVANAGADATICFSNGTMLNASGGSTYLWSPASGLSNTNISNPAASPASATNYTVTVTDANGCTGTDDIMVAVNPLAVVSSNYTTVDGCAVPATVTFTASSDIGVTYLWDFGDSTTASGDTVVHVYTTSGTFYATLTVITADGCSTIVTANPPIVIYPHPVAYFNTDPSVTPMIGSPPMYGATINFDNQSSGGVSYLWDFGDGGTSVNFNPQHLYSVVGNYTITLTTINQYGCTSTFRRETTGDGDIIFPNVFTPNSNGGNGGTYNPWNTDNDVFFPFAAPLDEYRLEIFNRWGELIFESRDIKIGWDGYYRGQLCQQDTYVWKVYARFISGKTIQRVGDVTLLR